MEKQAGQEHRSIRNMSFATIAVICFTLGVFAQASVAEAYGQSTFGEIRGVVRDAGGLPLPSALVVLHNVEKDTDRTVVCGGDGVFVAQNLSPGHYRLTAMKTGAGTAPLSTVELAAGQSLYDDITLASPKGSKVWSEPASPAGTGNSDRTSLTEREKQLLDRIDRLEQRLAAVEAKNNSQTLTAAHTTPVSEPLVASLNPVAVVTPASPSTQNPLPLNPARRPLQHQPCQSFQRRFKNPSLLLGWTTSRHLGMRTLPG